MEQKTIGVIGQKCGMTQIFTPEGSAIPVTVVAVEENFIVSVKTLDNDGYAAIQVKSGTAKANRVNQPTAGHYKKASVEPGKLLREFRVSEDCIEANGLSAGQQLSVTQFSEGQIVDATGISKGKGFAGTVKRHNFKTQDATHGNSLSHRVGGSTGQNQSPGRVFKGKKMAGQMGNKQKTVQNLEVVRVDAERNLLLIKGAVPGHTGANVIIKPAVKMINREESK